MIQPKRSLWIERYGKRLVCKARGMYRQVPKCYEEALQQNRLLILSYEKDNVTRISEQTAHKRNKRVVALSDEMKQI